MPDEQVLDSQSIASLRALSPDDDGTFVRELVEIYLQDTPQRLTDLEQALAKEDAYSVTRAAHTIKGSSSNFGAIRLAKLAHQIELQGKSGDLSSTAAAIAVLNAEYDLVAVALAKVAKGA